MIVNFDKITLWFPERIRPSGRFIKFILVGVANTVFGYGMFVVCLSLGMHYALAAAVATVLGVLFNFKSIGMLVFRSKSYRKLPMFVGVYVVVYLINVWALTIFQKFGVDAWLGGLILIIPCALLSYMLNSRLVFRI